MGNFVNKVRKEKNVCVVVVVALHTDAKKGAIWHILKKRIFFS